jgi:hypothetical protein
MNNHIAKAHELSQRYRKIFTGKRAYKLNEISGFSSKEIEAVEAKYNISLPQSYKVFLSKFGHTSKYLLADFDMTDEYPLEMTEYVYNYLTLPEDGYIPPTNVPTDMFVFANYLYEDFYFFCINEDSDDPAIYLSNLSQEGGQPFKFEKIGDSIWDFLDDCIKSYEVN